jgi:hypothetical protein
MILSTLAFIAIITGTAAVTATATVTIHKYASATMALPHNNFTTIDVCPCLFCDHENDSL